MWLRRERRCVR